MKTLWLKTLWIEDEDALNVGRVVVTKTGTKDCVICYSYDEIDDYEARLKADKWIPVSEGLPKVQDEYLVTWITGTGERFLQLLEFDVVDGEWILEAYMKNYRGVKIIAWKPLPEPYKENET